MKKQNIFKASLLMGVMIAASSCQEEKIYGVDPAGIPQASDYAIKIDVDQTTNQFTLSLTDANGNPAKAVYPVWKIYTKNNPVMSTRPVYSDIVTVAGDYDVEMQVGNHNGISEGVKTGVIHIENTMVDFTPYIKNLTDNGSKVWQIAANEQGHLGCGEPGTEGLNWWSAAPYDKADWGVYDNRMTFTDNGTNGGGLYTYDPGASGTIYVNTGIDNLAPYSDYNTNDGNDYCAPASVQETTFTLSPEGTDLFLVFPQGTLIGYLPNVEAYNNPKFKVYSITKNKIELSVDNGGIAWHYILQPEGADAGDKPFSGFKYDSDFNMWKNADVTLQSTWFANNDWGEIASPDVEVTNKSIKLHTPAEMGGSQWQGQVHIGTNIAVSSAETYDFSCGIVSNNDSKVTVKVQMDGDDNTFFVADQQPFEGGGSYYYFSDLPGFDGTLKIALDFGGNPDMDFEVKDIVFKRHADDDGTVLPNQGGGDQPGGEQSVNWVDVNSDANIWNSGTITNITSWTANNDWAEIAAPEITAESNTFTLVYSEGPGSNQWQAQFALETNLSFPGDKLYDFRVTINPTCDIPGATVKPTDFTDGFFWSADQHALEAYEDNVISLIGVAADMPDFKIVFDFAGAQAGSTIVIKDIIIQEHQDAPAAPSWVAVDSDSNLWKGVTPTDYTFYTAMGSDWSSVANPDLTTGDNEYTLEYSDGSGDQQWQAQFAILTGLSFPGDKTYDFRVTINPTCDIAGATVKPTNFGDDAFWSDGRHDLEAYEDNVIELWGVSADMPDFKIVFDIPGVTPGGKVVIKDIIIQEHQ